jgi:hypothetical protein
LALKSRAKLNRRCGDEEVLLHLFFKHHNEPQPPKGGTAERRLPKPQFLRNAPISADLI